MLCFFLFCFVFCFCFDCKRERADMGGDLQVEGAVLPNTLRGVWNFGEEEIYLLLGWLRKESAMPSSSL